ncbi:MAG: DUF4168 domain-containing protein [Cyanobacteria bacterium J06626_18]
MVNLLIQQAFSRLKMPRHLIATSFIAGVVGIVGIPASLMPVQVPLVTAAAIAQSEDFSSEEITQYARAVLEMDAYRVEAYDKIKQILLNLPAPMDPSEVNMSCSESQDISAVPRSVRSNVREILFSYCDQARAIVEDYGLDTQRFNEITSAHQHDATLSEKIQQELIRIQNDSDTP